MLVVSDNSPLRYLRVLACDHVLPVLFGQLLIPRAVLAELQHPHTPTVVRTWMTAPPAWLDVCSILGHPDVALLTLEAGEQEAIVLAQELPADLLLVDDGKARDLAMARGLRTMGTVGYSNRPPFGGSWTSPTYSHSCWPPIFVFCARSSMRSSPGIPSADGSNLHARNRRKDSLLLYFPWRPLPDTVHPCHKIR